MAWLILIASGCLEAVWATALSKSEGLTKLGPSLVFAVASVVSMLGLGIAMKELPVGTAYAVWVGIGATLTVIVGMATGTESVSLVKILLLLGIVACVAGLKLVGGETPAS